MLGASRGRWDWSRWVLCGQGADLDEVMGEYSVAAPGSGPGEGGQLSAVPSVAAFEVVDSAFTSGSPFDLGAESFSMFELPAGGTGFTGARDRDVAYPEFVQFGVHRGVPVAAISGYGRGRTTGTLCDTRDRRRQLRCIRWVPTRRCGRG